MYARKMKSTAAILICSVLFYNVLQVLCGRKRCWRAECRPPVPPPPPPPPKPYGDPVCPTKLADIVKVITKWIINGYRSVSPFSICRFDEMVADCMNAFFGIKNSECISKYISRESIARLRKCEPLLFDRRFQNILNETQNNSIAEQLGIAEVYIGRQTDLDIRTLCTHLTDYVLQRIEASAGGRFNRRVFERSYCNNRGRRICGLANEFLGNKKKYLEYLANDYEVAMPHVGDDEIAEALIDHYLLEVGNFTNKQFRVVLADCINEFMDIVITKMG